MHVYDFLISNIEIISNKFEKLKLEQNKILNYPIFEVKEYECEHTTIRLSDEVINEKLKNFFFKVEGNRIFERFCFSLSHSHHLDCLFFIDYDSKIFNFLNVIKLDDKELCYQLSVFDANLWNGNKENFIINHALIDKNLINISDLIDIDKEKFKKELESNFFFYLFVCIKIIEEINESKDHFIMQVTPKKHKKERLNNTYNRKDKYRLITSSKFYEFKGDKEGSQKCDHYRRGHWRYFNSERYVNKKGERIWIDAIWVGESEATLEGIKYKIRLDL